MLRVYRYAVPVAAALAMFGCAECFRLNVFYFSYTGIGQSVLPQNSSMRRLVLRTLGIGWVQVNGPKPYEDVEVPDGIDKDAWDYPLWQQRRFEARHKAELLNINHELDQFEIEHSLVQPTVTRKEQRQYAALTARREKLLKRITFSDDLFPPWPEVELGVTLAWARIINHFLFSVSMLVLAGLGGLVYGTAVWQDHHRLEQEHRHRKEAAEKRRLEVTEAARRDEEARRHREDQARRSEELRLRADHEQRERIESERRAEQQRREEKARSGMGALADLVDAEPEERMAKIQSAKQAKHAKKGGSDDDDDL